MPTNNAPKPDHALVASLLPSISKLPADEFWQHFERRYGVNPDLDEPMVKTMVE